MGTLKAFYRDSVIIFIIIIFGLGIGQVAQKAILSGETFRTIIAFVGFAFILAIPITVYRVFTRTRPPYCDDVLGGLTTILVSAVMVYTGFVLLGSILTL